MSDVGVGPPFAVVPGIVSMGIVLARTEYVAVVLVAVRVFEQGWVLEIAAAVRRGDPMVDRILDDDDAQLSAVFDATADGLTVGVDDLAAQATTRQVPVVSVLSGHAGRVSPDVVELHRPMWVSPRPRGGRFDVVTEWAAAGVGLTRTRVDTDQIAETRPIGFWD